MATKHNQSYDLDQGMSVWEKLSLFFASLNPLHFYEFRDTIFSKPICVFVTIVTLAPLLVLFNWHYNASPAEAPQEYPLIKRCNLYGETVRWTNKEREKEATVLKTLSRGEKVSIIGYRDNDSLFWVQTANQARGFIPYNAICKASDVASIANGLPEIRGKQCIEGTKQWLDKRMQIGTTSLQDVEEYWWGEPIAINHTKNNTKLYLPLSIRDGKQITTGYCFTFTNDRLSSIAYTDSVKAKILFGHIWATDWLVNSDFYTRFRTSDLVRNKFEAEVEDDDSFLPNWVQVIFGLIVLCIAACIVYVYVACVFIFLPMLIHRIGGIKYFPHVVYNLLMCLSVVITAVLVYWLFGGLAWWGVIILAVITIRAIMLWMQWTALNLCPYCNSFYTLEYYDMDRSNTNYIRTTTRYEKSSNSIRVVGSSSKKRHSWSGKMYYRCLECGGELAESFSGDAEGWEQ